MSKAALTDLVQRQSWAVGIWDERGHHLGGQQIARQTELSVGQHMAVDGCKGQR